MREFRGKVSYCKDSPSPLPPACHKSEKNSLKAMTADNGHLLQFFWKPLRDGRLILIRRTILTGDSRPGF
jgi:hypothetical protein